MSAPARGPRRHAARSGVELGPRLGPQRAEPPLPHKPPSARWVPFDEVAFDGEGGRCAPLPVREGGRRFTASTLAPPRAREVGSLLRIVSRDVPDAIEAALEVLGPPRPRCERDRVARGILRDVAAWSRAAGKALASGEWPERRETWTAPERLLDLASASYVLTLRGEGREHAQRVLTRALFLASRAAAAPKEGTR